MKQPDPHSDTKQHCKNNDQSTSSEKVYHNSMLYIKFGINFPPTNCKKQPDPCIACEYSGIGSVYNYYLIPFIGQSPAA